MSIQQMPISKRIRTRIDQQDVEIVVDFFCDGAGTVLETVLVAL